MCRLAYTAETMTLNNALETVTFRSTCDVNEVYIREQVYSDNITELVLLVITLELSEVLHWSYACLLEVTHYRLRNVLFCRFLEAYLNSFVAVVLYGLNLRNYTRTYFNYSAWNVLSISTEDGSHSDFFA
jgi:hypothetical protein